MLGAAGTALGIPLGWLAARLELKSVSATVQNLYLLEGIDRVALTPGAPRPGGGARGGRVAGRRAPSGPRRVPARPAGAPRLAHAGGADLAGRPAAARRGGPGSRARRRRLRRARGGSPLGGLRGGAGHPGRASAGRAVARPRARACRPAPGILVRLGGPYARPSPPVIGGRGGRAGGGRGHAHRDHRHGVELPRHRDRVARRHPARRRLRHHAHVEPGPRRGHALPRGPRPARPGSRGGADRSPAPDLRPAGRAARAGGGRGRGPSGRRFSRERDRRRRGGGVPAGPRRGGAGERAAGAAGGAPGRAAWCGSRAPPARSRSRSPRFTGSTGRSRARCSSTSGPSRASSGMALPPTPRCTWLPG